MTRDIALRVLSEPGASLDRRAWAHDILAWLDMGDLAAAKRCGYEPPPAEPIARARAFAPEGLDA